MKVLFVTPELTPHSSTGGLGEVAAALPKALQRLGVRVSVLSPFYRQVRERVGTLSRRLEPLAFRLSRKPYTAELLGRSDRDNVRHFFLDLPELFDRPGIYGPPDGEYEDAAIRYAALSKAAVALILQFDMGFDLIHCHDWQGAMAPFYCRTTRDSTGTLSRIGTVFTIHNLAYQGIAPMAQASKLGISKPYRTPEGLEFYGKVNLMKAGIVYADAITTVSPRYAEEIRTEELGCGLEGALESRRDALTGILNGVDYRVWGPERDPHLPFPYDASNQNGKHRCKAALQAQLGLAIRPRVPLVGAVTRLAHQKGIDILIEGITPLLQEKEAQLVILADGGGDLAQACLDLQSRFPEQVSVTIAFDDALAHQVFGGADIFAMPSRYEPCGLSQMYAMRYGTIPVVRDTGGLHDTVADYDRDDGIGTGFRFGDATGASLKRGLRRAIEVYHEVRQWRALVATAMEANFSWASAAEKYAEVYRRVGEERAAVV